MLCLMILNLHLVFSHFASVSRAGKKHNSLHCFCTTLSTRSPVNRNCGSPVGEQQEKINKNVDLSWSSY